VVVGDENGQVGVGVKEWCSKCFKKAKTDGRKKILLNFQLLKHWHSHDVVGDFGCSAYATFNRRFCGVMAGAVRIVLSCWS
jgi:ribosomal protein S5